MHCMVIFGYEDRGTTLVARTYAEDEFVRAPISEIGPGLMFLADHAEPIPPPDGLREAVTIGVRNWRRVPARQPFGGEYLYGADALAGWAEDIGRAEGLDGESHESLFGVSWWNFYSLVEAREAATTFLRQAAGIAGDAAPHLLAASEAYAEETRLLDGALKDGDAFLGPWTGRSIDDWSSDVRQREQDLLRRAREMEKVAIAALDAASSALVQ